MEHVGVLIKQRRLMMGMRVQELASHAQVSASYIYAIESGQRGNYFNMLVRIAKILELDLYELASIFDDSKKPTVRKARTKITPSAC